MQLPSGSSIPPAITRLTGIANSDSFQALSRGEIWARLSRSIITEEDEYFTTPLAVAHFARFEERFLRDLYGGTGEDGLFPLQFICTHEVARRLYPDLPRRGLRALAGFFGHPLPELKRASSHILATAVVWKNLIESLQAERGITEVPDLVAFLQERPPNRGPRWRYPLSREKRLSLPEAPGVYRFVSGTGDVLYVGKAASLRHRVNSYYRKRKAHEKILELVSQVRDIDITPTETCLEAALLEAGEIRRLSPPYNRALRDDGQGVWFFSRDLRRRSRSLRPELREGPVPIKEPIEGLLAIAGLFGRNLRSLHGGAALLRALGIPQAAFEPGAIHEGLRLFRGAHHPRSGRLLLRDLLDIGTSIRRRKNHTKQSEELDGTISPDKERTGNKKPLDADGIARIMEGIVEQAAILLRRGRWLRMLSESCIAWELSAPTQDRRRRLLEVRGGVVTAVRFLASHEGIPSPPEWQKSSMDRLSVFDRTTYDRLRILNTELKRLCSEGREVEVAIAPQHRFRNDNLGTILPTV